MAQLHRLAALQSVAPCEELRSSAWSKASSSDADTPVVCRCLRGRAPRAGSGSSSGRGSPCFPRSGGGRSKRPSYRDSSVSGDGSRYSSGSLYSSGLCCALALCLYTRALAAGAGEPFPQGRDVLVLWPLLRRLPVRGVLAEVFGEALLAGVEVDLDFDLLNLSRRGVVAH